MSVGGAVGVVGAWWCSVCWPGAWVRAWAVAGLGEMQPSGHAPGLAFPPANSADEIIELAPEPSCQSSLGVLQFCWREMRLSR